MDTRGAIFVPAPQHMRALQQANRVRHERAALKRKIAAQELDVAEVVLASPWMVETMSLAELLTSQRRWGRTRCRKFIGSLGLDEAKTIGSLTERQRVMLAALLTARVREGQGRPATVG